MLTGHRLNGDVSITKGSQVRRSSSTCAYVRWQRLWYMPLILGRWRQPGIPDRLLLELPLRSWIYRIIHFLERRKVPPNETWQSTNGVRRRFATHERRYCQVIKDTLIYIELSTSLYYYHLPAHYLPKRSLLKESLNSEKK
jgi:hypothetical protein